MTGLGAVIGLQLRRDRWHILIWVVAAAALWPLMVLTVGNAMDETTRRELVALAAANPALLFLRGAPDGLSEGAVTWFSMSSYLGIFFALQGSFHAVRHTRAEEESGRWELVGATAVHRLTMPLAALSTGIVKLGLSALVVFLGSLAVSIELTPSLLIGGSMWLLGITWLALGLLAAQLMPTARGANAVGGLLAGISFVIRGYGDATGSVNSELSKVTPADVTWLSPLGWTQLTFPFSEQTPLPLAWFAPVMVVLLATAFHFAYRRDLGAALLAARPGRLTGSAALTTMPGLVLRLHRSTVIPWLLIGIAMGVVIGQVAPALVNALNSNAELAQLIGRLGGTGTFDPLGSFVFAILGFAGVLACICAMSGIQRLRTNETTVGELLFAAPRSRTSYFVTHYVVGLLAGALTMVAPGAVASLSLWAQETEKPQTAIVIAVAVLPVVWTYLALSALLLGWWPSSLSWLGWILLFGLMLLGQLAPLMGDFEFLGNLSPFHWVANPLEAEPDWTGTIGLCGFSLLASIVGWYGFCRRDLRPQS